MMKITFLVPAEHSAIDVLILKQRPTKHVTKLLHFYKYKDFVYKLHTAPLALTSYLQTVFLPGFDIQSARFSLTPLILVYL